MTGERGETGAGVGAVHGGGLAHSPSDGAGAQLSGTGSRIVVRSRRIASGLHPDEEAPVQETAPPQRGGAPDRDARLVPRPQGRRRARRQDDPPGPTTRRRLRRAQEKQAVVVCNDIGLTVRRRYYWRYITPVVSGLHDLVRQLLKCLY